MAVLPRTPKRQRLATLPSHFARLVLLAGGLAIATGLSGCGRTKPVDVEGWNVLLLTLDTLRYDRVGFNDYEGARTATLDRLAREGVVFDEATAATPTRSWSRT